jgi:hypothetical protein
MSPLGHAPDFDWGLIEAADALPERASFVEDSLRPVATIDDAEGSQLRRNVTPVSDRLIDRIPRTGTAEQATSPTATVNRVLLQELANAIRPEPAAVVCTVAVAVHTGTP